MLLAIDVGNTETVIGLFSLTAPTTSPCRRGERRVRHRRRADPPEPAGLTHHWRLSTVPDRTPDEHAVLLTQLLDLEGLDVADVVTRHGRQLLGAAGSPASCARWPSAGSDVPCVVLEPGRERGMPILYDNPKEVGADRIANAVGAYDLYGGPCIVVDLGTATTFDAISARRASTWAGPSRPGVAICMEALFHHAAALRRVELVEPRSVIGSSTVESIQSGALYGFAAQVDGMCRRFIDELGPSTVVATGGLSELIAPHVELDRARRAVAHAARAAASSTSATSTHDGRARRDRSAPRGRGPLPLRADRLTPAEVHDRYAVARARARSPATRSSVAGRVMLSRPQGRLAFATLRDSSGRSSCSPWRRSPPTSRPSPSCRLGDWVGATGEVVRTSAGELSVQVPHWVLLAEARRGFGDKWQGVSDVETRFRQREVDLWANERSRRDPAPAQPAGPPPAPSGCGRRASSRSRRRCCTPIPGGATPSPSSPTTTRSTPTSTCASPPSST